MKREWWTGNERGAREPLWASVGDGLLQWGAGAQPGRPSEEPCGLPACPVRAACPRDGEGCRASAASQHSCLENPGDGGAWRAAIYGVAQIPTGLKRRSSSSSSSSSKGDTSKLNDNVFMDWITVKISILPKEISDLIQSLLKYLWHFSQNLNKLS